MLRFKAVDGSEFPDWEEKKLSDICEFITVGIANSATHAYRDTGVVMFRNQNIKENHLDTSSLMHIDSEYEKRYEKKRLKAYDLLVVRTGYPGVACLVPPEYEGAQTFTTLIVRLIEDTNVPEYVCQYINSPLGKYYFETTQIGGGQKNIGTGILEEFPINRPSLPEQYKIAKFLSTIDMVIEKQKETVTAWKERKKGVMQKLFSQEVRFKADDGSEFPEWEEKKIDDIATCFAGATPSTKIPEYWDNGTIQWMSSGEVNNGQIYETEKRISQLGFDKCSTKMVKPNTVVMALAGQGKTRGMVAITRVPLCTNQSLCAIETNDDVWDDYLYQYLQTQYNNLRLISSGDGTRGGLNLKLVGGYVVSMPCFIEQQKIVACLSALDDVIEKKKATLAAWEELKKGLLQQMFV